MSEQIFLQNISTAPDTQGVPTSAFDIKRIGIIGSGQMGSGIAVVSATAGLPVTLVDISAEALQKGKYAIAKSVDKFVEKGKISPSDGKAIISRVIFSTDYADFSDVDLVIEAASEDERIKKEIISKLCPVLKPSAIIVSNTSSLSITRLGASTDRPARFMGMHFMNPVPVMTLVELIRGIPTSDETFNAVYQLAVRLGKTPVASEDFPAFIVNRILLPMINEAIYTLYEGVGSVRSIDDAMKLGANHPMGPLELADFIGLDTCLAIMQILHIGLADSKYRPCPLLVKYVEAGWLGRKTGRGFYDYSGVTPEPTR